MFEREIGEIITLKKLEKEIQERRKAIENKILEQIEKPTDKNYIYLTETVKVIWKLQYTIDNKIAENIIATNPKLTKVFTIKYSPKITELRKFKDLGIDVSIIEQNIITKEYAYIEEIKANGGDNEQEQKKRYIRNAHDSYIISWAIFFEWQILLFPKKIQSNYLSGG